MTSFDAFLKPQNLLFIQTLYDGSKLGYSQEGARDLYENVEGDNQLKKNSSNYSQAITVVL